MTSLLSVGACCVALLTVACGDDNNDGDRARDDESTGGASDDVGPEPALVRTDCALGTSALRLSQPKGADVWGGLVVAEFEVEGAKVRNFDIQVFDPALDAWVNSYVETGASGQRDDGSYFVAVRPAYNEANRDSELKLRLRPVQDGCPNAEWSESEGFVAGDPIASTSWSADIVPELVSGNIFLQRSAVPGGDSLPGLKVELKSASLQVEIGAKGEISETLTAELATEEGEPLDGCTVSLTYSGTYQLLMRNYGGLTLAISDQTLTSTEGTTCELPTVEELALSGEDFELPLTGFSQQVNIDYEQTLWTKPGVPVWTGGFAHVFDVLPAALSYVTDTETGVSSGYMSPQELTLVKQ